ncbi:MAG TPA: response regulator [Bacteroidia bacterium]|nr:response regulator [Bacteroidia bacterium]
METKATFILIDNPIDVMVHKFMLNNELKMPADIFHFKDPQHGLKYIEATHLPDTNNKTIVILDMYTPGMSVNDFLQQFEDLNEKIKNQIKIFVVATILNNPEINKISLNPNVNMFLPKPLTEKNISDIVSSIN